MVDDPDTQCSQSDHDPVGDTRIIMPVWSTIDSVHGTSQPITQEWIVQHRLFWAGIWAILTPLVQGHACHYATEIADMPQGFFPFATDAKGKHCRRRQWKGSVCED